MPFHELAVAPADVTGESLGLALNGPVPSPLATTRLYHPDGGALLLGVLGASHVITVEHPARRFSEEVSCDAHAHGGELPDHAGAPGYRLQSRTTAHSVAAFHGLAARLRTRCARESGWLGGRFPSDYAALTVLAAEPYGRGWRWQTWHLYPASSGGTVVHTTSQWRP